MKDRISQKAKIFRRNISPVREIMNFADPKYIKSLGLDPLHRSLPPAKVQHHQVQNHETVFVQVTVGFLEFGPHSPRMSHLGLRLPMGPLHVTQSEEKACPDYMERKYRPVVSGPQSHRTLHMDNSKVIHNRYCVDKRYTWCGLLPFDTRNLMGKHTAADPLVYPNG